MRAIFFDSLAGFFSWEATRGHVVFRRSVLAGFALLALVALTFSAHTQGNQPQGNQPAYLSFQSALSTGGQNWCIDVPGGQYQPGTNVALATCTGTANQTFNTEGGTLTAGGLCLDAQGEGVQSAVTMSECNGGASQAWSIQEFQNGQPYLGIVNSESMCITVGYGDARQGAPLTLEYCQQDPAQGWLRGPSPAPQAVAGAPTPRVVYSNAYAEPVYYWRSGRRYCWYEDGWSGAGWYVCGDAYTRGVGYGGPIWWNNWWAPGQVWIGGGGGGGTFGGTGGTRGTRGTGGTTTTTTTIATTTQGNVQTVSTSGNVQTVATKGNTTNGAGGAKGTTTTIGTTTKGNVQTVATKGNVQTIATKGNTTGGAGGTKGTTTTIGTTTKGNVQTVATQGNIQTVATKGNTTQGAGGAKGTTTIGTTTQGNVQTAATKGNIQTVATQGNKATQGAGGAKGTTTIGTTTKGNVQTVATQGNLQTVATKGNIGTQGGTNTTIATTTKGNVQTVATKGNIQTVATSGNKQFQQQQQKKLVQQQKFQQQKFQQQKKFQQQRKQVGMSGMSNFQGGMSGMANFQSGMAGMANIQRQNIQRQNIQRQNLSRPPSGGSGGMKSDILLKHDVVRIGTVAEGIGLYRFQYNWSDQVYVGVVAQEVEAVRPDAVIRGSDGYLRVYYDRIGAPFDTWEHWQASGGQASGR